MKKMFIALCLALLIVPAVYARAVPAFPGATMSTVNPAHANRFQMLSLARARFAHFGRSSMNKHYAVSVHGEKDGKIWYTNYQGGKKEDKSATFDADGRGMFDIGGSAYEFKYDGKRGILAVAFLSKA